MSRLRTTIVAASLALAMSTQVFSSGQSHAAKGTAELQYRLVEIPYVWPDGKQTFLSPRSVNDRGEVLALGKDPTQTTETGIPLEHYFIWRRGRIVTELKTPNPAYPFLTALRINNRSDVVGGLGTTDPGSAFGGFRGFVWRHGDFTVLGPLPSTGGNTFATAINDWGEVAGYSQDNDIDIFAKAFRWYRGQFRELPVDSTISASAIDVNNRGQVIGNSLVVDVGPYTGFVWSRKGSLRFIEPLPGATSTGVRAINDRGQIVGTTIYPDSSQNRAFLWEDGNTQDLGTLPGAGPSSPAAINEFGTVVGIVTLASGDTTAMVWRDGEMRDLNEMIAADDPLGSRVNLLGATDINNVGWILAYGADATLPPLQQHSYLLIPIWRHRH
jgi:probable HAF family extracellular repeat protein